MRHHCLDRMNYHMRGCGENQILRRCTPVFVRRQHKHGTRLMSKSLLRVLQLLGRLRLICVPHLTFFSTLVIIHTSSIKDFKTMYRTIDLIYLTHEIAEANIPISVIW